MKRTNQIIFLVRIIGEFFLCYKIFHEVGFWTTLFAVNVTIALELQSFVNKIQYRNFSDFIDIVKKNFDLQNKVFKKKTTEDIIKETIDKMKKEN